MIQMNSKWQHVALASIAGICVVSIAFSLAPIATRTFAFVRNKPGSEPEHSFAEDVADGTSNNVSELETKGSDENNDEDDYTSDPPAANASTRNADINWVSELQAAAAIYDLEEKNPSDGEKILSAAVLAADRSNFGDSIGNITTSESKERRVTGKGLDLKQEYVAAELLRRAEEAFPSMTDRQKEFALRTICAKLQGLPTDDLRDEAMAGSEGSTILQTAIQLFEMFLNHGGIDTLEEAILMFRQSLTIIPEDHEMYGYALSSLANAMFRHYEQCGNQENLEEIISLHRMSLAIFIDKNDERGGSLNNLANAILTSYERTGDAKELVESISLFREALSLFPVGHSDRSGTLNNLANAMLTEYERTGQRDALVETIELYQEALELRPPGNPDRASSLVNLANALLTLYERAGDTKDLARATALFREALDICPPGHHDRSSSLNNLANALLTHYEVTGNMSVLEETIELYRGALALRSKGHPGLSNTLNNLANSLARHYDKTGDPSTLAEAIGFYRDALDLRLLGHPDRGSALHNLANALQTYYQQAQDKDALEEAITFYCEALSLRSPGHPNRGNSLSSLSNIYWLQYHHDGGDETILSRTLELRKELLEEWTPGHPDHYYAHHSIVRVLLTKSSLFNWTEALDHLMKSLTDKNAIPRLRLARGIEALRLLEVTSARDVRKYLYSQPALDAYVATIQLLPRAAHVGLDLSARLSELSGSEQLCRAAAMRAMLLGRLPMAVELLEEGKAVFWSQALRLRSTALDDLPLADRKMLRHLFELLEQDNTGLAENSRSKMDAEQRIERRRQLSNQADDLIEEIRQRPGFERFLKIPQYEKLARAASDGFVIALVANEPIYFAIVIEAGKSPQPVLLASVDGDMLRKLTSFTSGTGMRDFNGSSESEEVESERLTKVIRGPRAHAPLADIWRNIVEPIIVDLKLKTATGKKRPRVHWYPSGDFAKLPLHAAGIYDGDHPVCTSDYVVSSYTTSLSALIKARENFTPIPREEVKVALFGEPNAPGLEPIPSVAHEVQVAASIVTFTSAEVINDVRTSATVQTVVEHVPNAHVLHLACHGQQHADPLNSYFALNDGPLTISSLMELKLPMATLAYLGACETAKGDKDQPDQAVHLAASLLFCGFRSVVATMWSMYDDDGPRMAQWFYEALLENESIQLNDIPYALNTAVQKLRQSGAPVARWATYMHLGA